MKRFCKKENLGITLIALVITIIILLILAGVTIGVATNGTGLFEKAKLATDEYNNKAKQEETEIAKYSNQIDEYSAFTRAGGSNINYSLQEQDTGLKWINGETIWQKTFDCSVYWSNSVEYRDTGIVASTNKISHLIDIMVYKKNLSTVCHPTVCYIDNDHVKYFYYASGINTYEDEYVTIVYTKTTE